MFLIWQPFEAASQSATLSLQQCIDHALKNDYSFKIQALKVQQKEKSKAALGTRFLPQLDAYMNHQYTFGSAIDPNTNSRTAANFQYDNVGVNAVVNLFHFGELWQSKLQEKDLAIAQAQSLVIEQEYTATLIEKFYAALGTQEWLKVVREQLQNTVLQVERISKEVHTGLKPESDYYDIQVIYSQEKKTLIALEQEELNKKNELLQWINDTALLAQSIALIHESSAHPLDYSIDLDDNIIVSLEKRKKEKLEAEQKQLLSNFLPKVSLEYSYSTFFSQRIENLSNTSFQFGSDLKNNKSQYLGLGFRIPLYSRGDNIRLRTIKKLEINEQNIQIEKEMVAQKNRQDNYYRKLQQFYKLETILEEALGYAEKSLATTAAKYSYGKVDISAYKAAKNQVLASSYDIINNNLSIYMSEKLLLLFKN